MSNDHPSLAQDSTSPGLTPAQRLARADWLLYLDGPRAGAIAREVLAQTAATPDLPLRADAWWHVGFSALRFADRDEAGDANRRARELYAAMGNARGLLLCDEFDGLRLRIEGRLDEALQLHERIAARADVPRTPLDLYISHNSRAITRKLLVQTDGMLRDFYRAQSAAQRCESPGPRINALVNLGGCHGDLYNLPEAQTLSEQAMDLAETAGAWAAFAVASFNVILALDGLGRGDECRLVLQRLLRREPQLPTGVLEREAPCIAMGFLAAGDLASTRDWLDKGASAGIGDGDGKSDFARVTACWLMAHGRDAEARQVAEARIRECAAGSVQDLPYVSMRLLQAATDACVRVDDPRAALRYMQQAHSLYQTLVGRSSRAGFIALQAAHEYEVAQADRDRAREAHEKAERDRQRLAALNDALEERMAETQRLNSALQHKMAEAEALQRQLHEQAVHDPLTGLYNRRFLSEAAASRIELAHRTRSPLCIVLIDIDHFKHVNDAHGHEGGDRVLVEFARLLQVRMRRSDIVCRFGGEEFLLLVDPCEEQPLRELLEALLAQFRGLVFGEGVDSFTHCTFSAGIAVLDQDADDFEALVKIADQRMYQAKEAGRARVVGT